MHMCNFANNVTDFYVPQFQAVLVDKYLKSAIKNVSKQFS